MQVSVDSTDNSIHLIRVAARDADIGQNAKISYSLKETNGQFAINATSGDIWTRQKLIKSDYSIMVFARDQGIPKLSSTATVIVHVRKQITDKATILFTWPSFNITLVENTVPGYSFGPVSATVNGSVNGDLQYSIFPVYVPFSIDPVSGLFTVKGLLDREDQSVYLFDVRATYRGQTSSTVIAQCTVYIADINDNPPVFTDEVYQVYYIFFNLAVLVIALYGHAGIYYAI